MPFFVEFFEFHLYAKLLWKKNIIKIQGLDGKSIKRAEKQGLELSDLCSTEN